MKSSTRAFTVALVVLASLLFTPPARSQKPDKPSGGSPGEVKVLPSKAKRYALVVGVDKYADTQISTLGGASNDARALRDALVEHAGFPADQVILLSTDQPEERQPTRGNILRRLSNLASGGAVPQDGLLLFFFAGHGMERGGQAFLLPSDAQVSDDVTLLEQTAVNVLQVKDWVRKSGVRQVLMILDACRNDPAGRANADNPLTESYTRGFNFDRRNREVEAFVTLYATAIGKRAYEYKEKKQGYFTWALVEGLRGAAANEKGEVTLDGLVNHLQERVPKQVALDLGKGKVQKPFAVIEGYKADELVLGVASSRELSLPVAAAEEEPIEQPRQPNAKSGLEVDKGGRGDVVPNIEGTVWTGTTVAGTFDIEFMKEGKLSYLLLVERGEPRPRIGKWRQFGRAVMIDLGYSVSEGKIEDGVIRVEGESLAGEKFRYTLYRKEAKEAK
ncbi:MAG TPA: caspase family protein [Pyrinomonadaceae bacterium]|nr:caspase family protein [Pyrinomonadaceae bacterium]